MSESKKAQNLARIRDNQRRSRARRKEYLHELEAKLRSCEQMGVEASAEIQSAARRVLDENRKLRALLHERGVSDTELVVAMGGPSDKPYGHTSTAPCLSAMLDRKTACAIPSIPSPTSSPASTHSSLVGISPLTPAVPQLAIPVPRSAALNSHDIPSPHSNASGMDSPASFYGGPSYRSPMTPGLDVKSEDVPPYIPYDQAYDNSLVYQESTQYLADSVSYYNMSSGVDAANVIQTMRSEAQYESDISHCVPRQEFHLNNSAMFTVLDRYVSPQKIGRAK